MSPKEIIEQCTDNGLTLSITDEGNLDVVGNQDWIEIWAPILRENKSTILSEMRGQRVLAMFKDNPEKKYAILCNDSSTDPVLVQVTIKGLASFDLAIPHAYYDGIALLEVLERYAIEQEQAA